MATAVAVAIASARESTGASPDPAPGAGAAPSASATPAVPSPPQPSYRGLFSPDGRYIVLDALIDLVDANRRVPLSCDLATVQWAKSARVWCLSADHSALVALDVATGETTARPFEDRPFDGRAEIWFDASERFLGWGRADGTDLLDTETGRMQHLPGFTQAQEFHGSIARVSLDEGKVQLWDAVAAKPAGEPYVSWFTFLPSFSVDQRWSYEIGEEGQFVVELRTGTRTVIGTVEETTYASAGFGIVQPLSHDGSRAVASAAPAGARVVELGTGKVLAKLSAPGCESPMNVRWSASDERVVVGSRSGTVCAFHPRTGDLLWSTQMPRHVDPPPGPGVVPRTHHTEVSQLDFTVDDMGIVAGTVSDVGDNDAVLLRASNGALVKKLGVSRQVFADGDGALYAGAFLVGPNLSTTRLPSGWTPNSTSSDYFTSLQAIRCMHTDYVGAGCAAWKGVEILDRDAKARFVLGRAEGYLGVWSAVKGELLYSMHLPAKGE